MIKMRRKVAVIGVGMTKFGRWPADAGVCKRMGEEACLKAIEDAGISPRQIEVAYVGNVGAPFVQGPLVGNLILGQLGIGGIPVTRIEGGCSSSSLAFREAYIALSAGLYDIAIVIGVEKMLVGDTQTRLRSMIMGSDLELEGMMGMTFPGVFGMMATRRMAKVGTTREQMALVAVKNHGNALHNPYAHLPMKLTVEDVLDSRPVAYPLTLYECCPMSDGAAAVILASEDVAKKITDTPIYVLASVQTSGLFRPDFDMIVSTASLTAARKAYEIAKIEPKDVDFAEVHDCFSIAEIMHYEELGFCKIGEGGKLIEEGVTEIGGRIPVNPSGGLLGRGHPVGATGVAQVCEVVWQLRGEAGKRQVAGAEIGLTHTMGNFSMADAGHCAVQIFKRGD
jgi:acetyl-CoA C-acetyltransferase